MKRSQQLAPLSREHHRVLLLARALMRDGNTALRDALPTRLEERRAHVLAACAHDVEPHLQLEEQAFSVARGKGPALERALARLDDEHREIRLLCAALHEIADLDADLDAGLDALGVALEAHVRWEERTLFPLLESTLDPASFATLASAVSR
ncbi:MAG: hemerythrin domain-containing protein [Polyangiales bacterium]